VEVTDQHGWEDRIREFIDPRELDINNHVGVSPNRNLFISIDSDDRVILSDSQYPNDNPIYIKDVNISMLGDVLKA
jgi:hypothetical protein